MDAGRQGSEDRHDRPTSDRQQHADHVPSGHELGRRPLTQAEGEGGGSAEQCKLWPYREGISAEKTYRSSCHNRTVKNVTVRDTVMLV